MARSITPVQQYSASEAYPPRSGTDRRSFFRLALAGAAAALAGCASRRVTVGDPVKPRPPVEGGSRSNKRRPGNVPRAGNAPRAGNSSQATAVRPTWILLKLAAVPGRRVVVASDDARFLAFLSASERQAYLQLHIDPSRPGSGARPTLRLSVITQRLTTYYRMRTGRRTAKPRIVLRGAHTERRAYAERHLRRRFHAGDPPSALGVPTPPSWY